MALGSGIKRKAIKAKKQTINIVLGLTRSLGVYQAGLHLLYLDQDIHKILT